MAVGVLAGAAGLAIVTKSAIDFESSFAGVRKTVDATEAEFQKLKEGFRALSKEIPISVNEINRIGEAAGQLGIQKEGILAFTRVMADLGVATNLASEDAATALARFANITQMSQGDFDRLGSTIVELGNNLATTESEIVDMALRLAGTGSQIGLTEDQIVSLAAAMSSVGIRAEAGGTAMSRVMAEMANAVASGVTDSNDMLDKLAEVSGMTSEEFAKAFEEDAVGSIIAFIGGLGDLSDAGGNVFGVLEELGFGGQRVRDVLLRASGANDLFKESMEIGSKAWEENTALTTEAEQRYKTTASQIQLLRNNLQDVAITIGERILPVLNQFIQFLIPIIQNIGNMKNHIIGLIGSSSIFINLKKSAQGLVETIKGLLVPIIETLVKTFKDSLLPIMTQTIGFLIAQLPTIKDIFNNLVQSIGVGIAIIAEMFSIIAEVWAKVWGVISEPVLTAFSFVLNIVQVIMGTLADGLKATLAFIRGDWEEAHEKLVEASNNFWLRIGVLMEKFGAKFRNAWKIILHGSEMIVVKSLNVLIGLLEAGLNKMNNMLNNWIGSIENAINAARALVGGAAVTLGRIGEVKIGRISEPPKPTLETTKQFTKQGTVIGEEIGNTFLDRIKDLFKFEMPKKEEEALKDLIDQGGLNQQSLEEISNNTGVSLPDLVDTMEQVVAEKRPTAIHVDHVDIDINVQKIDEENIEEVSDAISDQFLKKLTSKTGFY